MGTSRWRFIDTTLKMDLPIWMSLVLAVITLGTPAQSSEPRVVCYYTNWSVYRPGTAKFNPQNINPYLCTHLIYAFGGFTKENTLKPFDKYQDIEKGGYAKFTGLKTYNKNLKTMLAIGGWNEGSSRFSPMVASRDRRKEFVRNAIKFLRQNRFDGLDLDWEYPAARDGSKPKDRENYAKLVKELREEFERESEKTGKTRLLLTMAVPAGIDHIKKGFDVKTLNQYLDWMNLLTYDYHSAFEPSVNHHAPLFPIEEPNEYSVDNELNIDYTIKFYIENGADADKLVLGIPTYGRSYTLFNPDAVEIGAPADGPGEQGDATREKGYLAYYEICEALKPKKRKRSVDDEDDEDSEESDSTEVDLPWTVMNPNPKAMGPIAYRGNQWVGYDDIEMVKRKAEYVAENGLGGIMFWSVDNDDFRGNCHDKPYPLIEAAKEAYIVKLGATDNSIVTDRPQSATRSSSRRRNRPRTTTTTTTTTVKPPTAGKTISSKRKSGSSYTSTTPAWNIVTPQPPTTPDPGADFKCRDEGFFPHPRDCKKYFWCLDSGPSNLGIVAHQFTCPSGLFFNKAADSCDFARNVLCKKPSATTKATTKAATKAATTSSTTTTTTTRRPIKLSTKNSVLFRTTTTTTSTTPEPEIEEEYEDELEDVADIEAEDPKVIKELIDLIKKVGGVEQLEKHLRLSETSASTDGAPSTTPSSLNKKLYKVLERTRGKNKFGGPSASEGSSSSNSRRGPQNAGLEASADKNVLLRKDKPQYTTINRFRPTTSTQQSETVEEVEEEPAKDTRPASRARVVEPEVSSGTTSKTLQYVNIRRARPTYTSDTADDTASRNALFERVEPYVTVAETQSNLDILNARRENTPEYVTIRRQRPSTEETTPQYQNPELDDESQGTALEREISSQPQYTSIVRARSTTLPPPETIASPEPTTILAVQISSLLNSPSPTEAETFMTETEAPPTDDTDPTTIILTSTSTTTKTTTTTTTEGPSVFLASTGTPRQIPLRRRGSTTIAPFTSSQVSPRNYTFISRRRPLIRPNEISSDTDETNEISRKIRSTTPNSREVTDEKVSIEGAIRQIRRKRVRVQPIQDEDSVVSAASPISRGQFRPQISRDEVVSLTPIDNEPPQFVQRPSFNQRSERRFRPRTSTTEAEKVVDNAKAEEVSLPVENETPQFIQRPSFSQRPDRRFRPRTSTTVSDRVDDSEVSAATVDVRRPSFPSRGRSRFTVSSSTTEIETDPVTTEATSFQRRPTFARFNPRPFAKRPVPSTEETTVDPNNDVKNTVTQRIPTRIPFGRTRPSPALNNVQGRKLPFPLSRSQTTTQQALTSLTEEEDVENKHDDISLSESAIEEKEHEENNEAIEEAPKRRIVIKKLRSPAGSSDATSTETIPINDSGKKRIKVIRRLPTSTTAAAESSDDITESVTSAAPRKRKIIRKIIRHNEAQPEIIAKSVGSLNSARKDSTTETIINYGEKTRPTLISTPTPFSSISSTSEVEEETKEFVPEILKAESDTDSKTNVENKEDNNSDISAENQQDNSSVNTAADVLPASDDAESDAKSQLSDDESKELSDTINPEKTIIETEQETTLDQTKEDNKPDVVIENEQKSVDISEQETLPEEITTIAKETPETTTTTTTQATPTSRTRLPYRPSKRLFSPSTEPSVPSSSKIFSRKYNPGVYTSPASADRESSRPSSTRRPLFTPRSIARRPYTTARTTPKIPEEEEEYSEEEEILDETEEPENKLVFVPSGQLYPRASSSKPDTKDEEEYESVEEPEEETDEDTDEQVESKVTTTTKKPIYNTPRVINSNTFRSSTTESSQKPLSATQNRTSVLTRFGQNKPIIDTKKRVQNVPVGYNSPVAATVNTQNKTQTSTDDTADEISTTISDAETEMATVADDYLSMTEATTSSENTSEDVTSTNVTENETTTYGTMETNADNDDYMEYTGTTTNYPSTQSNSESNSVISLNTDVTPEPLPETTTNSAKVAPIVKTQFNKLFSVSRVVEVNSKLDKHRLNKNNETTLVEEGKIMVEKKPVVDKIGEVSRFSFIKIVEDDIPIYLTKLGHVYPVENLPDNLIRIDEARNARALSNFADAPKENLVASESINEGYRHIKQSDRDITVKDRVIRIPGDDFLSYINEDKKSDKSEDAPYPSHWQFVPAAYESDKDDQPKAAKTFEIITPRTMLTDPSTLPLEALFKTERPLTSRIINSNKGNQPFVVYSASLPTQKEEGNLVKLQVVKPETSRSIITFAKGQEFNGGSIADEVTIKYPVNISVLPKTIESTSTVSTTTQSPSTESIPTSPIVELLTTTQTTNDSSEPLTLATATEIPTTTETVPEETTTQKTTPLDAKRSKFAFPRRPYIKPSNITRPIPRPRTIKKLNSTTLNSSIKPNKTSTFVPNKSRFTGNRAQNVPVDGRKSTPKPKIFSTESPRTTTERKLFFKPIRPAFRPAFVPRKSLTTTPATTEGDT